MPVANTRPDADEWEGGSSSGPREGTSLYLCYLGLVDPLTQSQVVAYLRGLAVAGYGVVLVTFEPKPFPPGEEANWRRRLAAMGICWYWLRYHKRPSVPATAWDVAAGIALGLRLIRSHRVGLVHARGYVPGVMALALKRLTGVRLLFDVRGFMAEEYVDAGHWPAGGALFRFTKKAERVLVRAADGLVVLTRKAEELLRQWYPREMERKRVAIIPCCVDFQRAFPTTRQRTALSSSGKTLVYIGKLGTWYLEELMADFVAVAAQMISGLRWQVWTQSDPASLAALLPSRGLEGKVSIGRLSPEQLPEKLAEADAGLSFIKPCLSKLSSSPTKIGEYLAAGLPVASTTGIGDVDALLTSEGSVGVLVRSGDEAGLRAAVGELLALLDDPSTPARCRSVAAQQLDLERIGWVRYRALYRDVFGMRR